MTDTRAADLIAEARELANAEEFWEWLGDLATLAEQAIARAEKAEADLAAHKAALADVVERAAREADIWAETKSNSGPLADVLATAIRAAAIDTAANIRRLAPPNAAPYAKVLEAARALAEGSDDPIQEIDNRRALVKALAGIGRG